MVRFDRPSQPSGTMENKFAMIHSFLCQLIEKLNILAESGNSRTLTIGSTTITEKQLQELLKLIK